MTQIDQILTRLFSSQGSDRSSLFGCDGNQIKEMMERQMVSNLPTPYVRFMEAAGRTPDLVSVGSDMIYPVVCQLKDDMRQVLHEEWPEFQMDESIFVFYGHQGYQFSYFHCNSTQDDPPIYYYHFNRKEIKSISNSFTEWLDTAAQAHIDGLI